MVTFPINGTEPGLSEPQQTVSQCGDMVPVTVVRLQNINGSLVPLVLPEKETLSELHEKKLGCTI